MRRHHVLSGIKVVDLTTEIAGPYAGKVLADLGAEVVKLEAPTGDPLRRWGPFADHGGEGALFRYVNRDKKVVPFDIIAEGASGLRAQLEDADVLLEDLGPRRLEGAGVDVAALRQQHPDLVVVRISPFGQLGPRCHEATTSLVQQAAAGWVSFRGVGTPHPIQVGGRIDEYVGGAYAALAAMTALHGRDHRHGGGSVVDLSLHETLVGTLNYPMIVHEAMAARGMGQSPPGVGALLGVVPCKDGWIGINSLTGQHWLDICALLQVPEFGEQQIQVMFGGPERGQFLEAAQHWLDEHTAEEILEISQAMRIPSAPVGDGRTMPDLAQYAARDFFERDELGAVYPGNSLRLSRSQAAPALSPTSGPADPALPFDGLRIVDFTTFWAGAYVSCYLGSFGADVVKVESVQRPDGFRFQGTFPFDGDDWYERGGMFQGANLNKRDVTLDLSSDEGMALARQLLASADVVLENFSPRVMENFGLTADALLEIKPDLIVVRMPGFGLEGPWRNFVGWAYGFEQTAGMAAVTGHLGSGPTNPGGIADPIVGIHAASALLGALEHRRRTGEGQLVELAQIEVAAALTAEQTLTYSLTGVVQGREGNRRRDMVQGVYPTQDADGNDAWIAISLRDDRDWTELGRALDAGDTLDRPDHHTHDGRWANHDAIDAAIAAATMGRRGDQLAAELQRRNVPASVVLVPAAMYDEPQLLARGYYMELEHPVTGVRRYPGWPMQFDPGPVRHHRSRAPLLGEHNDVVLGRELGLSDVELADLRSRNIIGDRPLGL